MMVEQVTNIVLRNVRNPLGLLHDSNGSMQAIVKGGGIHTSEQISIYQILETLDRH